MATAECSKHDCGAEFMQGDAILVTEAGHLYHGSCFPRELEEPIVPERELFEEEL